MEIKSTDGTPISSASGVHCSHAVNNIDGNHAAAKLPEGADEETASTFVMPAVGLNGVDLVRIECHRSGYLSDFVEGSFVRPDRVFRFNPTNLYRPIGCISLERAMG